jgi:hypothetical protein
MGESGALIVVVDATVFAPLARFFTASPSATGLFFAVAALVFFCFLSTASVKTSTSVTLTPYGLLISRFFASDAACFGARYLATIPSTAASDCEEPGIGRINLVSRILFILSGETHSMVTLTTVGKGSLQCLQLET